MMKIIICLYLPSSSMNQNSMTNLYAVLFAALSKIKAKKKPAQVNEHTVEN